MRVSYDGPKKILILGGGIAGLACVDAVSAALEKYKAAGHTLPSDLEVRLVEGESFFGGRAVSFDASDSAFRALHPMAPAKVNSPHGIHFMWHGYKNFRTLIEGLESGLSPEEPVATYNLILAEPDRPARSNIAPGAKVSALHVVDPSDPASAWDPRARAILRAYQHSAPGIDWLTDFLGEHFQFGDLDAWLSFLDILFNEDEMSPQLRWGLFATTLVSGELGEVERNPWLREILGDRSPQNIEIGELMVPLFADVVQPRVVGAAKALSPFIRPEEDAPPESLAAAIFENITDRAAEFAQKAREKIVEFIAGTPLSDVADDVDAAADALYGIYALLKLIVKDAAIIASEPDFDPRRSGYLKNIYKAAFSSPFGLDAATALRDVQFGHRNFEGAKVQVFDADNAQHFWDGIKARVAARPVPVVVDKGLWAKKINVQDGAVESVEFTDTCTRPRPPIPTVRPGAYGATVSTSEPDLVVSALLPQIVAPMITGTDGEAERFRRRLKDLGRFFNETVNLQVFLPKKIALPFADPPPETGQQPPFSISNLEGIFTILVDLERAWKKESFEAIRLKDSDTAPFAGSALEWVGSWGDVFTHDPLAAPGRYQWPPGVLRMLAHLAQDPSDIDTSTIDQRPWVHDIGAAGVMAPPVFGEVKMEKRDAYFERWVEEVTPLVVSQTLLSLAATPGLSEDDAHYLEDEAARIIEKQETETRYIFTRSCQAENKFFSAEPHLFSSRPHARFETPIEGLFCSGDWVRNGLNVQCMESAAISGLQSAYAVIEAMRAGGPNGEGLEDLEPPFIDPSVLPAGAWDPGEVL